MICSMRFSITNEGTWTLHFGQSVLGFALGTRGGKNCMEWQKVMSHYDGNLAGHVVFIVHCRGPSFESTNLWCW